MTTNTDNGVAKHICDEDCESYSDALPDGYHVHRIGRCYHVLCPLDAPAVAYQRPHYASLAAAVDAASKGASR